MILYLLVLTLSGVPAGYSGTELSEMIVQHSFGLAYQERASAEAAVVRIQRQWADQLGVTVQAHVYELCIPVPDHPPCPSNRVSIRRAPLIGGEP